MHIKKNIHIFVYLSYLYYLLILEYYKMHDTYARHLFLYPIIYKYQN